ncbi:MAG: hypothetical protein LAT65_19435 [Saccharospirillum sp.]|nr:hypothetical protein [Saccharospirillum sp.]
MSNPRFSELLQQWEAKRERDRELEVVPISLARADKTRLLALADVYGQPLERLMADLLHTALEEVECSIPYVPGDQVIRMEDGDPCYNDIGKMPEYMAARRLHGQ